MFEWGKAICYSGYRRGQSPEEEIYPDIEQIKEDLEIIDSLGVKYIRMYDPVPYAENVCQAIRDENYDIKMMLGPGLRSEYNNYSCQWLRHYYTDEEFVERAKFNDMRICELIRIANKYSDVINSVSIGNENTPSWGANNVPAERLCEFADRLHDGCSQPVTFNEGAVEWFNIPEIAAKVDIISIHSYPLWYGNNVDEALEVNQHWYEKVKNLYPDKPVLFSEVGWSTESARFGGGMKEGQTNEDNQTRYYEDFCAWVNKEKIIAYMFEAFDEPWKGGPNPDEAEKHWGIYDVDRNPKPAAAVLKNS